MYWVDHQVSTNQQISQPVLAPDTRPRAENAVYVHVEGCPGLKRLTRRQVSIGFIKCIPLIGKSTAKSRVADGHSSTLVYVVTPTAGLNEMNIHTRPRDLITPYIPVHHDPDLEA